MSFLPEDASRARIREAEAARRNRLEIVQALSTGQVSRRELFKWGIFTAGGALACINGLSPYAPSVYAATLPTGIPRSPLFGAKPFTQPFRRLNLQTPLPLTPRLENGETVLDFPSGGELPARRLSYHTEFTQSKGEMYTNPWNDYGPQEGRPPGEYFAHQRWNEFLPEVAYIMSLAPVESNISFHDNFPEQEENKVWGFGEGRTGKSTMPPPLIKMRYGEPAIVRSYNMLPLNPRENGGFGSNSQATHNHNGHNGSGSDGASNAHHYPGQFYDYHWTTCLARADMTNTSAMNSKASGPDGKGGLWNVAGDYRELQGSMWFHDHRFFYTAENVYKGHLGALNYYSGPDRGNEAIDDGVNLRLPSGTELDWGNIDFDVNLIVSDAALDQDGQYQFDIFNTIGFIADQVLVNFTYKPFFEVLPRKYRFRILAASMSRFWKFALVNSMGKAVPMTVIATDGNFLPAPVTVTSLDWQSVGERFDVIVDFSAFPITSRLRLVNMLEHEDGNRAKEQLSLADTLARKSNDPAIGDVMQFRVVGQVESVDAPGKIHKAGDIDRSVIPPKLTDVIPIEQPVRERVIEFKGADGELDKLTGECFPDCGAKERFGYTLKINGESNHFLNANRISMLIPRPGEVEHWTIINGGGGWDHPMHLHFEEGRTISRGSKALTALERNSRKDVWRLGVNGKLKIQVRFGEFGGAYVTHCHNTVHEDWAMVMRYDILTDQKNDKVSQTHRSVIPTPSPSPNGVTYVTPEILPEGNPFARSFRPFPSGRI